MLTFLRGGNCVGWLVANLISLECVHSSPQALVTGKEIGTIAPRFEGYLLPSLFHFLGHLLRVAMLSWIEEPLAKLA